jgi:hypothetical protein
MAIVENKDEKDEMNIMGIMIMLNAILIIIIIPVYFQYHFMFFKALSKITVSLFFNALSIFCENRNKNNAGKNKRTAATSIHTPIKRKKPEKAISEWGRIPFKVNIVIPVRK